MRSTIADYACFEMQLTASGSCRSWLSELPITCQSSDSSSSINPPSPSLFLAHLCTITSLVVDFAPPTSSAPPSRSPHHHELPHKPPLVYEHRPRISPPIPHIPCPSTRSSIPNKPSPTSLLSIDIVHDGAATKDDESRPDLQDRRPGGAGDQRCADSDAEGGGSVGAE